MSDTKKASVFFHRQFFRLWLGQITSQAGTKVYQIAIIWWIITTASIEESGLMLGAFMVAQALPSLLFFKLMGNVVDRMPAKPMLVVCDFTSAAIMALVAWQLEDKTMTITFIMLFGFLIAFIEGFFNPAISKCLPTLVDEEYMEEAVAYQSSTQYLASFGGSVLGALLIAWIGIPLLVMINAISYIFSALIELTLEFPTDASIVSESDTNESSEIVEDRTITTWSQIPMLKSLLYGFGMVNFFATPVLLIVPLYVKKTLDGGPIMLGLLEASLWIGILVGTFSATYLNAEGRTIKIGAISVLVFGLCLFIPGLMIHAQAYGIALFIAGISLGINNVKFVTLFQRVVPAYLKGRFFAAMQAIIGFSFPAAYLIFGYLGDIQSPEQVCLIQGVGMFIVSAWFFVLSSDEKKLIA